MGTCLVFLALVVLSWSSANMDGLQDQLMELAAKNIELTQRLATAGSEHSDTLPSTRKFLMLLVIDTRFVKQPAAFDGDGTKWADWALTFRAYASAASNRTVVWMEHAQGEIEPLDLPTSPSDRQVNAQLYCVLAMLVKDGALKKARNAPVGHGSEIWRLLCDEYEQRQRRRFHALLSAILRVQLREPLGEPLGSFANACIRRPDW